MVLDYIVLTKVFISAALGTLVGLERSLSKSPAGTRTQALVSLGACLFTIIGMSSGDSADFSRVLPGIIIGIGFIGGGIIYQSKHGEKHGLTTAADIWSVAAIGVLVGMGSYETAFIATAFILFILRPVKFLERKLGIKTAS
ncbi:MAG: MgtC/SapB family protein [Candidatus Aenigmarchaeota archaeon]|nr:MgtC/SapB family protein [Candidatus Aenigmarchaeota archaeon]